MDQNIAANAAAGTGSTLARSSAAGLSGAGKASGKTYGPSFLPEADFEAIRQFALNSIEFKKSRKERLERLKQSLGK